MAGAGLSAAMEGVEGPPSPFVRHWREAEGAQEAGRPSLRVISFNILAGGLARGSEEPLAPDAVEPLPAAFASHGAGGSVFREGCEVIEGVKRNYRFRASVEELRWQRRWPMLLSLILEHDPDLVGLQEVDLVDGNIDGEDLVPHDKEIRRDLAKAGYEGTFAKKRGRACDGVGLFWKKARLKQAGRCETWSLAKTVHVALAQPLCLDGTYFFCGVVSHLKAGLSDEAEAVRVQQAESLLQKIGNRKNAVLLADLNAHCHRVFNEKGDPIEPRSHSMLTRSLWSANQEVLGEEPDFTVWGGWEDREVRLVCDYILLRGELLTPHRVLEVPAAADVARFAARLPNAEFPSDHVPMVADLLVGDPNPTAAAAKRLKSAPIQYQ